MNIDGWKDDEDCERNVSLMEELSRDLSSPDFDKVKFSLQRPETPKRHLLSTPDVPRAISRRKSSRANRGSLFGVPITMFRRLEKRITLRNMDVSRDIENQEISQCDQQAITFRPRRRGRYHLDACREESTYFDQYLPEFMRPEEPSAPLKSPSAIQIKSSTSSVATSELLKEKWLSSTLTINPAVSVGVQSETDLKNDTKGGGSPFSLSLWRDQEGLVKPSQLPSLGELASQGSEPKEDPSFSHRCLSVVTMLWLASDQKNTGRVCKLDYFTLSKKLQLAAETVKNEPNGVDFVEIDWEKDSRGRSHITFDEYRSIWKQILQVWGKEEQSEEICYNFLYQLAQRLLCFLNKEEGLRFCEDIDIVRQEEYERLVLEGRWKFIDVPPTAFRARAMYGFHHMKKKKKSTKEKHKNQRNKASLEPLMKPHFAIAKAETGAQQIKSDISSKHPVLSPIKCGIEENATFFTRKDPEASKQKYFCAVKDTVPKAFTSSGRRKPVKSKGFETTPSGTVSLIVGGNTKKRKRSNIKDGRSQEKGREEISAEGAA